MSARVIEALAGFAIPSSPGLAYTVPSDQHLLVRSFTVFRPGGVAGAVSCGLYVGGTDNQHEAIFLQVGISSWVTSQAGWAVVAEAGTGLYVGHATSVDTVFYAWVAGTLYSSLA